MDESLKASLLKSIELEGSVERSVSEGGKIFINQNLENVLDRTSGKARIRPSRVNQFNLIVNTPLTLKALSPFEIRCLSCSRVISYPSWHLELRFDRNTFHYFVCFSEVSSERVKLTCLRVGR